MSISINVPELGESVLEATVHQWLKKEGDHVEAGEALVELETDKVNLEVGAKTSGVLSKITVQEGQDVKVGQTLGLMEESSERAGPQAAPQAAPAPAAGPAPAPNGHEPSHPKPQEARPPAAVATPVASRLAREKNLDLTKVLGTGPEGRITKVDVERYMEAAQAPKAATSVPRIPEPPQAAPVSGVEPSGRGEERQRMSRRRRTIAQRMLEATQSTAMLTTFNEVDMSAVMDLRRRRNEAFQQKHGIKLGITSFFVKSSLSALKAFPRLNAEIQGDEWVLKHYYDIGVAVGAQEGLVVPVLRNADTMSFAEIERQIKDYAARADAGTLTVEDLRGGTFTVTNGGIFGSLMSTPILSLPQVGILGLHKIEDRPIVRNGEIVIRPMMYVALTYDHRIVDGREAVQFLVQIKQLVEDPEQLLLEG